MLRNSVQNGSILYGPTFISYNIQNLIHIADDCDRLGALDSFSAYVFENHLGVIKRLLRKSEKPLQQVVKRLAELDRQQKMVEPLHDMETLYTLKFKHTDGPTVQKYQDFNQFKQAHFKSNCITGKTGDNCILLSTKEVVVVENIIERGGEVFVVGKCFNLLTNFFPDPFHSTNFDIFKCQNLSTVRQCWPITQIAFKVYLIPIPNSNNFAAFPLENMA